MRIELSSFSYPFLVLKENILPVLTEQQKRIVIIASAALALLTACYVIGRCCGVQVKIGMGNEEDDTGVNGPGCKVIHSNGTVEEGDFSKGKLNGRGKKYYLVGPLKKVILKLANCMVLEVGQKDIIKRKDIFKAAS